VVVQVILGQVGESHRAEVDPPSPAEIEGVRRYLHHRCFISGRQHLGQIPLDVQRFGSGASCREDLSPDPALHRAHESRPPARPVQQMGHKKGGGGLSVGAGDAYGKKMRAGSTVERSGDRSHRLPHRRHHDLRDRKVELPLDTQGARPPGDRFWSKIVPVADEAGDAEEERAFAGLVAPIGEGADVDIGGAGQTTPFHIGEEVTEYHRRGFYHRSGPVRSLPGAPTGQSAVEGPIPRHLREKSAILAKAGAAT
jgi:hypothetical protein